MSGDALYDEYARATCLVLSSVSEPWGLVVNDALSYGCSVVVSDNCGCAPELVLEGRTGCRFATSDGSNLRTKLGMAIAPSLSTEATVQRCIQLMRGFTPTTAAAAIINGLSATVTIAL
jgi:glycosyltransferase involved in cell wall biosynthesis